ncbi:hypothetical protein BH11CYA1_BH11CYA1_42100 [soil metagenome]
MKKLEFCLLTGVVINIFSPFLSVEAAPAIKSATNSATSSATHSTAKKLVKPASDSGAGQAYSARLWNRILSSGNWNYPDGTNHVTLTAVVLADGNVESSQIASSPKSAEAESSAQAAFDKVKPLDALPTGMTKATITLTFNSKSDPHGDSGSGGSVRLDPINSK